MINLVDKLQAPFPYFGGKAVVAAQVWQALGQPKHYIEPFFGSGAVLLARSDYDNTSHIETVNDLDGMVCNVWRSLQFSHDEVAKWCDWPVNHADLSARKRKLIEKEGYLLENLAKDDEWHDPKLAGYWIWAASCWIGTGLTRLGQIPHLSDGGKGVHKLGQIPHISVGGMGVHKLGKIPHISECGMGVQDPYNTNIYDWFRRLSERLRYVRVVCGDWTRVCSGDWQDGTGICGIFFDPPYGVKANRASKLYHQDSLTVADDVRMWALKRGERKTYRIVFAGYYEEHESLLEHGWTVARWSTGGGYANQGRNNDNRHKEALFFSPHCIREERLVQGSLV